MNKKKNKKYYYIYLHRNNITDKVYIGQTCQNPPESRWKKGRAYRTCTYLFHAIEKYGWSNFSHVILEEGYFTKEEVNDKEDYYINLYNSRDVKYGYNINPGGV